MDSALDFDGLLYVVDRPAAPQIEVVTLKPSAVQINWVSAGNGGFDITGKFSVDILAILCLP